MLRFLGIIGLLVSTAKDTKYLAEDSLFLFRLFLLRLLSVGGSPRFRGRRVFARRCRLHGSGWRIAIGGRGSRFTLTKQMRQPASDTRFRHLSAAMHLAILGGLATLDEVFVLRLRAGCGGQLSSLRIHGSFHDAIGRCERLRTAIGGLRHGSLHEFAPDRRGGLAASQAEIAVIVKTDPDHTKQIRSVTSKPAVTRSARLSRCRRVEPQSTDWIAGAEVDHILHQRSRKKSHAGVEHRARLGSIRFSHLAVGCNHTAD